MSDQRNPADSHAIKLARTGSFNDIVIGMLVGLKPAKVQKLRVAEGIGTVNKLLDRKPLSGTHAQIGLRLAYLCDLTGTVDRVEFLARLGWTPRKLQRLEQGTHPLEIIDIYALAGYFKCPVTDILNYTFGE